MKKCKNKEKCIHIRCTEEEKRAIEKNAKLSKKTITSYLLDCHRKKAVAIIRRQKANKVLWRLQEAINNYEGDDFSFRDMVQRGVDDLCDLI